MIGTCTPRYLLLPFYIRLAVSLVPFPIATCVPVASFRSAITGTGTGELLDSLATVLPPPRSLEVEEAGERPLAVAIVGRPNVGEWAGEGRAGVQGRG